MTFALFLSDEAQRTIENQMQWFEAEEKRGGADLPDRWLTRLETALTRIAAAPHRHGLAPEHGRWHPELEVRQMQFRPWKSGIGWRVLFVIHEEQGIVTVLQVRHERRRWLFEAGDG